MPRPLAPHGTYSAYKRHLREKSVVCELCVGARNERTAAQREQRRPQSSPLAPHATAGLLPSQEADYRAALERNLELVTKALESVATSEPVKLAPLSKRHSELLTELRAFDGPKVEEDPFDAFFAGSNVIGISTAPSRKQA
jgi:hypothetical protein